MPDAFFQRKRKRTDSGAGGGRGGSAAPRRGGSSSKDGSGSRGPPPPQRRRRRGDDEDEDDDDDDGGGGGARAEDMDLRTRHDGIRSDDEAEAAETPAQARVRLAKMYLDHLKDDDALQGADAAEIDRDNIAARLQRDVLEHSGHLHITLARRLVGPSSSQIVHTRGHRLPVTAVIASADAQTLFSASKDGSIYQWRLSDGKLLTIIPRASRAHQQAASSAHGQAPADYQGKGKGKAAAQVAPSSTSGAARRRRRARDIIALQLAAAQQAEQDDDQDVDMDGELPNGSSAPMSRASRNGAKAEGHHQAHMHFLRLDQGQGHSDAVWALALSSDGRYLASGGLDRRIGLWDVAPSRSADQPPGPTPAPVRWIKALSGHKDGITSLSFRLHSPELYSASLDRTLKLFDAAQGSYIETLFGHQDPVLSLSTLRAEVAVSAGGRDRTCRWWKIRDESQLVFRAGGKSKVREVLEGGDLARILERDEAKKEGAEAGGVGGAGVRNAKVRTGKKEEDKDKDKDKTLSFVEGSVDCVAMIDDQHFLSGGDSGTIALWSITKKKAIFTHPVAHGLHETKSETEGTILTPRWITSLACLPYGDLFASGSWDGHVRLWALDAQPRSFAPLPFTVEAPGFVNSLQLLSPSIKRGPRRGAAAAAAAAAGGEGANGVTTTHAQAEAETDGSDDQRVIKPEQWRPSRRGTLRAAAPKVKEEEEEEDSDGDDRFEEAKDEVEGEVKKADDGEANVGALPNGHAINGTHDKATKKEENGVVVRGRKDDIPPLLVIGVGQEPRLGRWMRMPEARNGTIVVSFQLRP